MDENSHQDQGIDCEMRCKLVFFELLIFFVKYY